MLGSLAVPALSIVQTGRDRNPFRQAISVSMVGGNYFHADYCGRFFLSGKSDGDCAKQQHRATKGRNPFGGDCQGPT
jgi:hypothetical protein